MDFLENQSRLPGLAERKKLRPKPYRVENRFSVPITGISQIIKQFCSPEKESVSIFFFIRLEKFCKSTRPVVCSKCLRLQAYRLENRIRCPTYENGLASRSLFPTTLFFYCLKVFGRAKLKTSQGVSNGQVCSVRVVRPIYL